MIDEGEMRKLLSGAMSTGMMLTLLVLGMLALTLNVQPARSSPVTTRVPDDYATIQAALEAASPGDTVYVKAGTYYENVVVNKTLSLVGENSQNTTIKGSDFATVVNLVADGVDLTGFTIRSSTTTQYPGVTLKNANHCHISGNNIINNDQGIYLLHSDNNEIIGSNITANTGDGVLLYYSSNNSIAGNNIINNDNGVFLASSSSNNNVTGNNIRNNNFGVYIVSSSNNNNLAGNDITNNKDNGVYVASFSAYNSVTGNNIANNTYGVAFASSSNSNSVTENNITNNTYGVLGYSLSYNSSIVNNNVTSNNEGIDFSSSSDNSIVGNNIISTDSSILLGSSSNNRISENNITAIYGDGIQLYSQSNNNSIVGNNITANNANGIYLNSSFNNSVVGNNMMNNSNGVRLDGSSNNMLYDNSLIGNTQQVNSRESTNLWDNGSRGNYWSDYQAKYPNATEISTSGAWNTPYAIDANNIDHYPLVNQPTIPEFPSPLILLACAFACFAITIAFRRRNLQPVIKTEKPSHPLTYVTAT